MLHKWFSNCAKSILPNLGQRRLYPCCRSDLQWCDLSHPIPTMEPGFQVLLVLQTCSLSSDYIVPWEIYL